MDAKELKPGDKVYLLKPNNVGGLRYSTAKAFRNKGLFIVEEITERMIRLRKKPAGYIETVSIIDLRQYRYRLKTEQGAEVIFKPMVNYMRLETEKHNTEMADYRKGAGKSCYKSMFKTNKKESEDKNMVKLSKIETKEVLDVCRKLGTGKAAFNELTLLYGISLSSAKNLVNHRDVRQLLKNEKAEEAENTSSISHNVDIEKANTCNECVYGISNGSEEELLCQEGPRNDLIKKNTPACEKFYSVNEPEPVIKAVRLEKCPFCNCEVVVYNDGTKKCSLHNCEFNSVTYQGYINTLSKLPEPLKERINEQCEDYMKMNFSDVFNSESDIGINSKTAKIHPNVDEMMEMVPEPDVINHPAHYKIGGIEVTDYIQAKLTPDGFEGFCIGTAIQYLSRYRLKGGVQDIKKAIWYANRLVNFMEAAK